MSEILRTYRRHRVRALVENNIMGKKKTDNDNHGQVGAVWGAIAHAHAQRTEGMC